MSRNNEKSSMQMFEDLMNLENGILDRSVGLGRYTEDSEDFEEFITSKEIVKNKEKVERKTGTVLNYDGTIEESVNFKRYSKRREHKYTESEMNEIRKSCKRTIVHDYGEYDIYHISDEERLKNDQLAEISMKLGGLKRLYTRVDQYIEAMRIVFQAWDILEKMNFIHTKDEFFGMVADGKIVSNRIIMPKLKRMNQYNIDMIIKYISNPELDASHLVPKKTKRRNDDFFEDDEEFETEEEEMARLLSPEEAEYIYSGNQGIIKVDTVKPKYIRGYDRRTFKKKKKESKRDKMIRENLAAMLNKIQNGDYYREHGSSYMVTHSLFEPEKVEKSFWDDLYFDGSWANDNDVRIYDMVIREELLNQRPIKDKYLTYGDKALEVFFRILEDNGVSTIDLRTNMGMTDQDNNKKRERGVRKENKKIESAIIQRITQLNKSSKFKKIVEKAEDALIKYKEGEK